MNVIDRKFQIKAVNPVNGKTYTEADSLLLCAKDKAVPAALRAYNEECRKIGANAEHIVSIGLLIGRVEEYQHRHESKVPDTIGAEIPRCLNGEGVELQGDEEEALYSLLESTANMLRGMTLDPAIPAHAKDAMREQIKVLESKVDDYNERGVPDRDGCGVDGNYW